MSLLKFFHKTAAQSRSTSEATTSIVEEDDIDASNLDDHQLDQTCESPGKLQYKS